MERESEEGEKKQTRTSCSVLSLLRGASDIGLLRLLSTSRLLLLPIARIGRLLAVVSAC